LKAARQRSPAGFGCGRAAVPPPLAERQLRPTGIGFYWQGDGAPPYPDEKNGGNKKAPDCSGALMKTN